MVYATLQQQGSVAMFPDGWCPKPAFISEQASSTEAHKDTKRCICNRTAKQEGKGAITHCTPTCSTMQAEACFGQDAGHCRHRGAVNSAASVADRTFQKHERDSGAKETVMLHII